MLIEIEDSLIRQAIGTDGLKALLTDDSACNDVTAAVNKLLKAQLDLAQKSAESDSDKPMGIGKCSVAWVIDIDEAMHPTDAATQALRAQRRKDSIATVFTVTSERTGEVWEVDLDAVESRSTEKLVYGGH